MEVGSTVTLLVNIDNPSKFPLLKEQKLNPKSVQFLYTINCKMKRRISWGSFTLFSKEWATGHVLAEGRFKEPDYQYSEQEWTQSGYEEKFCKKTKPFWRR
jgi:hypothetical protein